MTEVYQGKTNAERRRFERKEMSLNLQFRCLAKDNISDIKSDLAEDLGAGGLAMRSDKELNIDQLLMVTITLPVDENDRKKVEEQSEVSVLSRVAWTKPAKDSGYIIGIQFLDLEPTERQILKSFLVEYQLDRPDSSLYT